MTTVWAALTLTTYSHYQWQSYKTAKHGRLHFHQARRKVVATSTLIWSVAHLMHSVKYWMSISGFMSPASIENLTSSLNVSLSLYAFTFIWSCVFHCFFLGADFVWCRRQDRPALLWHSTSAGPRSSWWPWLTTRSNALTKVGWRHPHIAVVF